MNETKKPNFGQKLVQSFTVFGNKMAQNKHFSAITDAFSFFIPALLVGSFAVAIDSIIVNENSILASQVLHFGDWKLSDQEWWQQFAFYVDPIFTAINSATMGFFVMFFVFNCGYLLSQSYGDNAMYGGIISAASFLLLNPIAAGSEYFGAQGLILGMIIAPCSITLYHKLIHIDALKFNMPSSVPKAIGEGLTLLIPIALTLLIMGLIQPIWALIAYNIDGFGSEMIETNTLSLTLNGGELTQWENEDGTVIISTISDAGLSTFDYQNQDAFFGYMMASELEDFEELLQSCVWTYDTNSDTWNLTSELANSNEEEILNTFFSAFIGDNTLYQTVNFTGVTLEATYEEGLFHIVQSRIATENYYLFCGIENVFFVPFSNIGRSWWATGVLLFFMSCFYLIGAHGPSILAPVISPIWLTGDIHNAQLYLELTDTGIPISQMVDTVGVGTDTTGFYIFTDSTAYAFCKIGGTGFNFATMIAAGWFSKDAGQRAIGKLAIAPGFFGVNEPITFGLPIVLNFFYLIPQTIPFALSGIIAYMFVSLGWINPTFIMVPWSMPWFVSTFMHNIDWRSIFPITIIMIIALSFWIPWILFDSKKIVKNRAKESGLNLEEYIKSDVKKEYDDIIENKAYIPFKLMDKKIENEQKNIDKLILKAKGDKEKLKVTIKLQEELDKNKKVWEVEANNEQTKITKEITEKYKTKAKKQEVSMLKSFKKDIKKELEKNNDNN